MAAWERASDAERERARARLGAVRHAEELIAAGRTCRKADAAAAAEAGVAAPAVGRWRRKARRLPQGARVAALLDAKRTGRPPKIDPEMRETLESLAYERGAHLTSRAAHEALLSEYGRAPALSTVREFLRNWRKNERARAHRRDQPGPRPLASQAGGRERLSRDRAPEPALGARQHDGGYRLLGRQALRNRGRDRHLEPPRTGTGGAVEPCHSDSRVAAALHPGVGRAGVGAHGRGQGLHLTPRPRLARRSGDRAPPLPSILARAQAAHRALPRHADAGAVRATAGLHGA